MGYFAQDAQGALTKQVDAKGRPTLGEAFANATVLVEAHGDDEAIVKLARVIPQREAWLYENATALASVRRGLNEAVERRFVDGRISKPPRTSQSNCWTNRCPSRLGGGAKPEPPMTACKRTLWRLCKTARRTTKRRQRRRNVWGSLDASGSRPDF
jgi:hypothetical protein